MKHLTGPRSALVPVKPAKPKRKPKKGGKK